MIRFLLSFQIFLFFCIGISAGLGWHYSMKEARAEGEMNILIAMPVGALTQITIYE